MSFLLKQTNLLLTLMYKCIYVPEHKSKREIVIKIKNHGHRYPLTLCEIELDGKHVCYRCCSPFLDNNQSCSDYFSQECHACGSELLGSYYSCKIYWPNSLSFYKLCVKLSRNIGISSYPHRSLKVEVKNDTGGFCDKIPEENRYTFRRFKFDFKINFRCGALIVNYHEGREHIEYFGYKHPLTLLDLADKNSGQVCYKISWSELWLRSM